MQVYYAQHAYRSNATTDNGGNGTHFTDSLAALRPFAPGDMRWIFGADDDDPGAGGNSTVTNPCTLPPVLTLTNDGAGFRAVVMSRVTDGDGSACDCPRC